MTNLVILCRICHSEHPSWESAVQCCPDQRQDERV